MPNIIIRGLKSKLLLTSGFGFRPVDYTKATVIQADFGRNEVDIDFSRAGIQVDYARGLVDVDYARSVVDADFGRTTIQTP